MPIIVRFIANPSTIDKGESSTLLWSVLSTTGISISGIGTVPSSGSRSVRPSSTTRYTLTATGPPRTVSKTVTVTVVVPPPPEPPPPTPEPPPPEPPPPTPPPTIWDWIIGFVLSGFENLLGWQHGSLLTLLANVKDLITNFFGDIYDFFTNVIGDAWDAVSKFFGDIADFVSDSFMGFVDWILDIGGDIAGFVTDSIEGIVDFVTSAFTDFVDWLNELGGSIADYIGGAIGDFVDWSSDQLGGIWEGISGFFTEAISGFVEAFFGGVNTGIEQAKTSPLHSDEPVRNPVLKGLQKVVREHRKKHNRDEITGEKKHGNV